MKRLPPIPGNLLRILLTLGILVLGGISFVALRATAPEPKRRPSPRVLPVTDALVLRPADYTVRLPSQGNIVPRTRTQLTAEVPGKIASVSESFRSGARFEEGEELVLLDPRDYENQVERAEAALVRAETALALARAQTEQARQDWERFGRGEPSELALKLPQLREAEANVRTAETDLREAKLNVSRCHVRAPYEGRVLTKAVDVGQYVTTGALLGEIYSTDAYEVRLPLREDQLRFLDLPGPGTGSGVPAASVSLRLPNGEASWRAMLTRTEASIDPGSRQLFVVASLDLKRGEEPLLPSGTFVEAEIEGRTLEDVLVIPRSAVRSGDTVLRITAENTLDLVRLDVLYAGDRDVYVTQSHPDLPLGSRISVTPLPFASEGDAVFVEGETRSGAEGPPEVARSPRT